MLILAIALSGCANRPVANSIDDTKRPIQSARAPELPVPAEIKKYEGGKYYLSRPIEADDDASIEEIVAIKKFKPCVPVVIEKIENDRGTYRLSLEQSGNRTSVRRLGRLYLNVGPDIPQMMKSGLSKTFPVKQLAGRPKAAKKNICEQMVFIGMTKDELLFVAGDPDNINRTVSSGSVTEQWVYNRYNQYYYFHNGELRSWQD